MRIKNIRFGDEVVSDRCMIWALARKVFDGKPFADVVLANAAEQLLARLDLVGIQAQYGEGLSKILGEDQVKVRRSIRAARAMLFVLMIDHDRPAN